MALSVCLLISLWFNAEICTNKVAKCWAKSSEKRYIRYRLKINLFLLRMQKTFFFAIILLLGCLTTKAQTLADALRYSQTTFGGTARNMGVGGALGALGGDFSVINVNPAGLGLYSSSEFVLTPGLRFANANTDYLDNTLTDSRTNFFVGNIGLVLTRLDDNNLNRENSGWQTINFALGYNRSNNFNTRTAFRGFNANHSFSTFLAEVANGIDETDLFFGDERPFDASLAYNSFVIDPVPDTNQYTGIAENGNVQQEQFTSSRGGMDEMVMAIGANYKHRLYLGATLGIPLVRYREEIRLVETDVNNLYGDFDNYEYNEMFTSNGVGFNLKLGLSYRINSTFRVGAAFHSATSLSLDETYLTSITSEFSDDVGSPYVEESPSLAYSYQLQTPWRLVFSGAAVLKKYGFITLDYEFVDYRKSTFQSDDLDFSSDFEALNTLIDSTFTTASNLRIGAEFARNIWRLRTGFALYTTPFRDGTANTRINLTLGAGIRQKSFFVDLAYVLTTYKSFYQPYTLVNQPVATAAENHRVGTMVASVGFRF